MGKTKSKPKKSKRKQADLPGVEGPGVSQPHVPEIEDIAEEYVGIRDKRMALTKQEVETRGRLSTVMKNHNLTRYPYDGKVVLIKPGQEKIKVQAAEDEEDEIEPIDLDYEDD